ncbi:MAG: aldo/keto reductase [Abditibacteriota bacterium]|nr:aldo/keto reductase [Abditibacteriota bacterium]
MLYADFAGTKLSRLGFGTMRLPVKGGNDNEPDRELVNKMVAYAMKQGVNYYDTAWGYHGGNSETAITEALRPYDRDSYYLADKFPGYDLSNMPHAERIFEEQLRKCEREYFDFYLIHNVCELNIEQYLDPKYGIYDYFSRQKDLGRIRHLGFSVHGSLEVMERFLAKYGDRMEFCQIQLNWLDWHFQKAGAKVELCRSLGLPVWVMEPVRGGMLLRLSEEARKKQLALRPEESAAGWCFRFIQSVPEVCVTLSGMSDMAQVEENIDIFSEDKPLSGKERQTLFDIAGEMTGKKTLPCTACRYCVSHCPRELNIPDLLALYNEHTFSGGGFLAPMALMSYPKEKRPSACIGCKSCEAVCPQGLEIAKALADLAGKIRV